MGHREPFTVDLMNADQSVDRNLWKGAGMSAAVPAESRLALPGKGRLDRRRTRHTEYP